MFSEALFLQFFWHVFLRELEGLWSCHSDLWLPKKSENLRDKILEQMFFLLHCGMVNAE